MLRYCVYALRQFVSQRAMQHSVHTVHAVNYSYSIEVQLFKRNSHSSGYKAVTCSNAPPPLQL
jgi:hypothetical protein